MGGMRDEIHKYVEQVEQILAQKRAATGIASTRPRSPVSLPPLPDGAEAEAAWKAELRTHIIEERLQRSGLLTGPTAEMSFRTFQREEKRHKLAYAVVSSWLEGYPHTDGASVLLWSKGFGAGKTHLARGVQRCIIEAGGTALFKLVAEMLAAIRASYDSAGGPNELAIVSQMAQSRLLIWDDLGKEYVSSRALPWFHNIVFRVLDERYRHGQSVLVTSNVDPKMLPQVIGGASASRLMEMVDADSERPRVCDMSGPDWRMRT